MKFLHTSKAATPCEKKQLLVSDAAVFLRKEFFRRCLMILSDLEIVMHFAFVINKLGFWLR
jgi:hypothetical protein